MAAGLFITPEDVEAIADAPCSEPTAVSWASTESAAVSVMHDAVVPDGQTGHECHKSSLRASQPFRCPEAS